MCEPRLEPEPWEVPSTSARSGPAPRPSAAARLAFLFPSQGSEEPGMGLDLLEELSARERQVVREVTGWETEALLRGARRGSGGCAEDEVRVQTGVYLASALAERAAAARGLASTAVLGYSSGIYAALVAARSLDFEGGLRCVWEAGWLLAEASRNTEAGMLAIIGVDAATVERTAAAVVGHGARRGRGRACSVLVLTHRNAARQQLAAGERRFFPEFRRRLLEEGALAVSELPYGVAYHSPLVRAARLRFARVVARLRVGRPRAVLIDPRDGRCLRSAQAVRELLVHQLDSPVDFVRSVGMLQELEVTHYCELGPGQALSRLLRWTARGAVVLPCGSRAEIDAAEVSLRRERDRAVGAAPPRLVAHQG